MPKNSDHFLFGGGLTMRERTVWSQSAVFGRTRPRKDSGCECREFKSLSAKSKSALTGADQFGFQRSDHVIHLHKQVGLEN